MGTFIRRAEEILDVAVSTGRHENRDYAIVIRHDGGVFMLDGTGWGLSGLLAEYGARQAYKVETHGSKVRVAGLCGSQTCLIEREFDSPSNYRAAGYATRSQAAPLAIAGAKDWSPQVLNS